MESLGQVPMYSYENKTSLYLNDSVVVYLKYWYNGQFMTFHILIHILSRVSLETVATDLHPLVILL